MNLREGDIGYKHGHSWFILTFRGREIGGSGLPAQSKASKSKANYRFWKAEAEAAKERLISLGLDGITHFLRDRIEAIAKVKGTCGVCGNFFDRNMIGRPRQYCSRGCNNIQQMRKFREKARDRLPLKYMMVANGKKGKDRYFLIIVRIAGRWYSIIDSTTHQPMIWTWDHLEMDGRHTQKWALKTWKSAPSAYWSRVRKYIRERKDV